MIREITKIDIGQIAEIEECHTEVEVSMDTIIENYGNNYRRDNFRNYFRGKNFRGGYRRNYRNNNFGRDKSRSRDGQCLDNIRRNDRSSSRSRSGP